MKAFAGIAVAGLAVASSSLAAFWILRRLRKPQVGFLDVVYDKTRNQLELFVVNDGESPVYVNPSVRLVHFLNPDEWREKNSNGNGNGNGSGDGMVAGKCYQVDSVIKGYTLVGECPQSVRVDGKSVRKIIYPLSGDVTLRVYDNIHVDSLYGRSSLTDGRLTNTMRVVLKDDVDGGFPEIGRQDGLMPVLDAPEDSAQEEIAQSAPTADLNILPPVGDKVAVESCLPVQSTCVSCGRGAWMHWIVDGNVVCTDCKNVLKGNGSPLFGAGELPADIPQETDKYAELNLKPRQFEILQLLENENNLSVKKIAKLLSLTESTVASDLKFLMQQDVVGRIEIGKRYLYHLAC